VYDGLWFSPLKRALDGFVDDANENVSGDIRLTLHGGRAVVTGRRSDEALYDYAMATYDSADTFDQSLAKGFVELWGLPSKMAAQRDQRMIRYRVPGSSGQCGSPLRCQCCGEGSERERRRHDPPVGRPLQRRAERCAEPAVGERALRLAAGALRPAASGRTRACCTAPACSSDGELGTMLWALGRPRAAVLDGSFRPTVQDEDVHTRSSAACSSGSAPSAASCAPGGAATTRSRPTCGCSCATPPGRSPRGSPSWRPR
jgi:hypothetical protein